MAAVLIVCILLFTIPTVPKGKPSSISRTSVLSFALSSLLQIIFITLVDRRLLTLNYSLKFAGMGIPACIVAIVLARRGNQNGHALHGVMVISASLGLAMWVLLIMLH
jgi:hypothetical protein